MPKVGDTFFSNLMFLSQPIPPGELPWVPSRMDLNPDGVASNFRRRAATPLGLFAFGPHFPG